MSASTKRSQVEDPYLDIIHDHWDSLVHVFATFESKLPVLLFDIQEQRIYAYPYQDFVEEMAVKDRPVIARSYEKVVAGKSILVFVRDNEKEKLVSSDVDLQEVA